MNRSYDIEDDVDDEDDGDRGKAGGGSVVRGETADATPIQYQPESGALDPVEAPSDDERDRDPRDDI